MLVFSCGSANTGSPAAAAPVSQPDIPLWRGFNLLNMFYKGGGERDSHFNEEDFKMMSEWGFNFARIPVDYRILIRNNDWNSMNEQAMQRIDKAIEYGNKYNIHICLNLHRAPGYTVASPPETSNLWTQKAPQEAFARMWAYFAERYRNVSSERLSFNFINEPPEIEEAVYAAVIKKAADAIRAKDPKRLLIADGINYGRKPSYLIKDLGIVQATRGYEPFSLTHYKAEWVNGADNFPRPQWPVFPVPGYLYGTQKSDIRSIYSIEHEFPVSYNLDVNVGTVSHEARLVAKADGAEIYNNLIKSGPGTGDWEKSVYKKEWNIYQNIFNKDYRISVPAGTKLLTLEVTGGDWMTVNGMKFSPASGNGIAFNVTPNSLGWGEKIPHIEIDAEGKMVLDSGFNPGKHLWDANFKPWGDFIKNGGRVIVGEWGSYNKTPHDAVLEWMEDNLRNFKDAGIGWALWNLTDSFGILNSGRDDVEYEDFNGYKLDRKMLDLLLKYL